jgi:sulfur-carrier protein
LKSRFFTWLARRLENFLAWFQTILSLGIGEVNLSITIRIPPPLRKFTAGVETAQSAAHNLSELFEGLETKFPGIRSALCADDGTPHRFLNIYVNDEDIRFLGGAQPASQDGDEVLLVPAIAGGCDVGDHCEFLMRRHG